MLEITTAASLEQLAQRCATVLQDIPSDPFASGWIATPNPGVRRWLELRLAKILGATGTDEGDGIVANVEFANIFGLRQQLLSNDPSVDAWSMSHMIWALCTLGDHRAGQVDHGEALTSWARRVADLFTRYDRYRPDMIRAWANNTNVGPDAKPLAAEDLWQPELFRTLREVLGAPAPCEKLPLLTSQLRDGQLNVELAHRLVFFGFHLPPATDDFFALAQAVAVGRPVHLYLLDPSPYTDVTQWATITRSWAARSASLREQVNTQCDEPNCSVTKIEPVAAAPTNTLLGRLQQSIMHPTQESTVALDPLGRSIQIHGAQGEQRQVEVLRDVLCGLLADDHNLQEDDIVVLCGDLDRFVPHIQSVFGTATTRDPDCVDVGAPRLRYQIDGVAAGVTNPVALGASKALELTTSRYSALEVIEFVQLEAVQRRFGFDGNAIDLIRRWMTELDVRWGLDAQHRGLAGVPQSIVAGTWQRALDRLCHGVAHAHGDIVIGDFLPYGVESGEVATLGSLVDLVRRLSDMAKQAITPIPISDRLIALEQSFRGLVAAPSDAMWQLDAITRTCGIERSVRPWLDGVETTLTEVRPELLHSLQGGGRSSSAFRGGITFTTMSGLDAVPFRAVCLLGLDDQALQFSMSSSDDLMGRQPQTGDPDRRSEATDALLASVCAASACLYVFHNDRSPTTNEVVPDATVLADFCDAIEAAGIDRATVRVTHPRHATDPTNFASGGHRSFDQIALAGAKARLGFHPPTQESVDNNVALQEPAGVVALADLVSFYKDPAKAIGRNVLGLRFPDEGSDPQASLRIALSRLEKYDVRTALLGAYLENGVSEDTTDHQEKLLMAGDQLPVGSIGVADFTSLVDESRDIAQLASQLSKGGEPELLTVRVPVGNNRVLVGEVACVATKSGFQIFDAAASKMKMGDRLRVWIQLLGLMATHPDVQFESALIRKANDSPKLDSGFVLTPPTGATVEAREALVDLVALFDRAQVEPIPLFPEIFAREDTPPFLIHGDDDQRANFHKIWDKSIPYNPHLNAMFGDRSLDDLVDDCESILAMINDHFEATMEGGA